MGHKIYAAIRVNDGQIEVIDFDTKEQLGAYLENLRKTHPVTVYVIWKDSDRAEGEHK